MAVAGEAMRGIGRTETSFARSRSVQAACGIVSNAGHPHGYASLIDAEERTTETREQRTLNGPKGEETQHV